MATNGTSQDQTEAFTNDQNASGQSIFWALTAIVLNAMLQPSFCGYLWSGDVFEDSLWPHRSSPTICLLDAIAETWIIVDRYRNPGLYSDDTAAAKPIDVATRLAVFFLAVMPQAIKLFSMQGIPVTQVVAAMFLVPTIVGMARATCIDAPHRDLRRLVDRLKASNKNIRATAATGIFGWLLHGIALLYVWFRISGEATITTTENITNAVNCVSALISTVVILYILQHTAFILAGSRSLIPRCPIAVILAGTNNFGIADLILAPNIRAEKKGRNKWMFTVVLLLNVSLCSYGIAYILEMSSKVLLNWFKKTQFAANSSSVAMVTLDVPDEPETTENPIGSAQHPVANASQSTADGDLLPTYDQATLATTVDVPSLSLATNVQEMTPATSPESYEDSINENITVPISHQGSGSSTAEEIPKDVMTAASDPPSGDSSNGGILATSSTNVHPDSGASLQTVDDDLTFPLNILCWIFVPFAIVLWYGEFFPPKDDSDKETAQQSAAEQGIVEQRTEAKSRTLISRHPFIWKLLIVVNKPFRLLVRYTIILVVRLHISGRSLFDHTFNWISYIMGRQSKDTLMVSFGITNFATAIVYYMTQFDGTGTFTPGWTAILG